MRDTILLGLDVGGSSIKAGLVDTGRGTLTSAMRSVPTPIPSLCIGRRGTHTGQIASPVHDIAFIHHDIRSHGLTVLIADVAGQ